MISTYGPDEGIPELREKLRKKLAVENGLEEVNPDRCDRSSIRPFVLKYDVIVTAGANQAFMNCLLTFCDHNDGVVMFKPYYFNHAMSMQMTGSSARLIEGVCDPDTFQPDLDWLEQRFRQPDPPKMVVLINPNNPTGLCRERADDALTETDRQVS